MWNAIPDPSVPNASFTSQPRSLLLTLKVDRLTPFHGTTGVAYSCGAVYLPINNLPRSERYKTENVILVGVIPGPTKPTTYDVNSYLRPLVTELVQFYQGVDIETHQSDSVPVKIRAALLMVDCDIPAPRKVSGFTAHNSTRACYRCDRTFKQFEDCTSLDYTGFNDTNWKRRTKADNERDAQKWKNAQTEAEQEALEQENSTRWSGSRDLSTLT